MLPWIVVEESCEEEEAEEEREEDCVWISDGHWS